MDASARAAQRFRDDRLTQVLILALLAFGLSAAYKAWVGAWEVASYQVLELACLTLCWWLLKRGRSLDSVALLLWSLTLVVCYLVWTHQGLRDPGMLVLAGILVLAGMLGSGRLVLALVGFMVAVVIGLVVAAAQGWHLVSPRPPSLGTGLDVALTLAVIGAVSWLTAHDLVKALQRSEEETRKAKAFNARLEYLAHFDELTGLANRAAMRLRFEQAASLAQRNRGRVALLYLDLDHFKHINDAMGHPIGDDLLKAMALRFQSVVRRSDTVGRLGGDEFLVLLTDVGDHDALADVAIKLLRQIEAAEPVNGLDMAVTASMGIAVFPQDGQDFDSLLKKADIAMYRAKESGRNTFRFCDAHTNASVVEHVQMVSGIKQALAKGEFVLHYQPQLRLGDGSVIGAEALIRWRHPDLGLVPPLKFIPVAEKSGQIVEIGAWVLKEACAQAAKWRELGLGEVVVSVNVSPVQFRRGDIEAAVVAALQDSGLPAHLLELELTESLFIEDSSGLSESLKRLRAMGVSFSIDDFGTGYSNLGYLRRFDVERLKIDRSFVSRLAEDAHDEAIVRAIIQMAQGLGLRTIAEGVEDQPTMERLSAMGCEQGQGYHWSRPVPPEDFERFASRST
jgi:diguanylate cyclase (GGDEF)-like protein